MITFFIRQQTQKMVKIGLSFLLKYALYKV